MRSFLIATGALLLAAHVQAQTSTATTTTPDTTSTAPPLIKSVADDPNDSPMVRAAKRAVASRQNTGQRRVVTLAASGAATRGRVAVATGPTEGPKLPPLPPPEAKKAAAPLKSAQQREANRQAEVQEKLKQLQNEEERIAAELLEETPEMDEDLIDKRLAEIEAERKRLQQSTPPPPPGN